MTKDAALGAAVLVDGVARKTGRRAILIEKRESQCQAIAARLAQGDLLTANGPVERAAIGPSARTGG